MKVAYSTGFWCTNIGNAFFSLGVEHVLKEVLGEENVCLVSDFQTYTTSYGRRLFPHKNQLEYISNLDVDYIVLAGPVISKYFLGLWKNIIINLEKRGIGYILLSAGMMKMTDASLDECKLFFKKHPPFVLCSRDRQTYETFGKYAKNKYDGICFAFFAPDYYSPCVMSKGPYMTLNFDKCREPAIDLVEDCKQYTFSFDGKLFLVNDKGFLSRISKKTDRFSDAIVYAESLFPERQLPTKIGEYTCIRTDHRFHPHFRRKIYAQHNSFCADLPYGYLNIYANSDLTLSDRVHACAVTMAYGHSAMLFSKTNRVGLLDRVGASRITEEPVTLDLVFLKEEKKRMVEWLKSIMN